MKPIAKSAIIMIIMMLLSKILGLLREMSLAVQFGASYIVDAYTICCSLPSILFAVFANGFADTYLPIYSRIESLRKKREFFGNTTSVLFILSLMISIVCLIFSRTVVSVLAPGFTGETFRIANNFIKVISFYLPFFTVFSVFCAQSCADEDFILCNFCNFIITNSIIILSIYLSTPESPNFLAYGYVISMIIPVILLGTHLWKKGIRPVPSLKINDSNFRLHASIAIPVGISLFANQTNALIDRAFSSSLGEGVTSALSYANKIQLIPYSLVVSIFISICRPRMNKCFAENNKTQGTEYIRKAIQIAVYLSVPVVVFLLIFASPIIKLLLQRGAFTSSSTIITSECLTMYSIGIPFYAFREIATNALSANLKQKVVLKNTLITVVVNVILDFIMVEMLSYRGLALATSIAGIISFLLMNNDLKRMGISMFAKDKTSENRKVIIASLITIFISYISYIVLKTYNENIAILVSLSISIVIYFLIGIILNINILRWIYLFLPDQFKFIHKWNDC